VIFANGRGGRYEIWNGDRLVHREIVKPPNGPPPALDTPERPA
jgi:hypothetical protein